MQIRPMPKWMPLAAMLLALSGAAGLQPVRAQETPAGTATQGQPSLTETQSQGLQKATEPAGDVETPAAAITQGPTIEGQPATQTAPDQTDGASGDESTNPTLPHDLSPLGMFLAADVVVKGVMIGLALASVATWAILIAKSFELATAKRRVKRAVRLLTEATVLRDVREDLGSRSGPAGQMVIAAGEEIAKSEVMLDIVPTQGLKERVASRLTRIEAGAGKGIAGGTGILATIGSISPFVGLFGTVWGIMNSFIGISQAQTTNLAIVAPGIAEALLATAIGLVAAIPAVVIYNYFSRSISGYRLLLADASAAVERLVSRDLDFRAARRLAPRKPDSQPHQADAAIARIG